MGYILYVLIFIIVFVITAVLYGNAAKKSELMKGKLSDIRSIQEDVTENEFRAPFGERVIKPAYDMMHDAIAKFAPVQIKERYQQLIITAGSSKKITPGGIIITQFIMAFFLAAFVLIVSIYILGAVKIILVILGLMIGFSIPVLLLYSKSKKRKEMIRSELPDFLDLLYLSVEAGLGFDQAMKGTAEKMQGMLGEEIRKTMSEIVKGRERDEAFRGLEKRTGVDEVGSFVVSVIQTERLGSNITNMLKAQSAMMRMKRRQHAEEVAAKMSIKMLFPLIICFLPAMFVVILGPGIINIFETLFNFT